MLTPEQYREERRRMERDDLAQRKRTEEENRDPEFEQCVIAYVSFRQGGGMSDFQDFKRGWYATRS
jgi:hypothetical protein